MRTPETVTETEEIFSKEDTLDTANGVINTLYIPERISDDAKILEDISFALRLKEEFYQVLGIPLHKQPVGALAFEPWLERARYDRIINSPALSSEQKSFFIEQFKEETRIQMVTNLRERHRVEQSTTVFIISGDKLQSALLSNEDLEDILDRGLEYRKQVGSKEIVREEQEVVTFKKKIQPVLTNSNTPIGTMLIAGSPPSADKDTPYGKRFIDIWQLKENDFRERYVERIRFTTGLSYEGYKKGFENFDPDYFNNQAESNLSFATYVLSHPVVLLPTDNFRSSEALYRANFEQDSQVIDGSLFQEGLPNWLPLIDYFTEAICRGKINWSSVAMSFNATLNISDEFFEVKRRQIDKKFVYLINTVSTHLFLSQNIAPLSVEEQIAHYGKQPVKTKAGPCGPSSGFSNSSEIFENSVGSFGTATFNVRSTAELTSACKECGKSSVDNHYHCPKCKERYADETHKSVRTSRCGCGFEFGC